MRKKVFVLSFFILFAPCIPIGVQGSANVPKIGFLSATSQARSFWKHLNELGYVDGQNIIIVRRNAHGKLDRLPKLAAELVDLKVDVIFVNSAIAAITAKKATTKIPIVAVTGVDLVRAGLVANLARPGGNITGFTMSSPELGGKRLELLKEAFPSISRVGVLRNPVMGIAQEREFNFRQIETAAEALGLEHFPMEVSPAHPEFARVFEIAKNRRVNAFLVVGHNFFARHMSDILKLVAKTGLPAMYNRQSWVRRGGLMFYGPRRGQLYQPAARYVEKILNGTNPGDLPVQRATRFHLYINLKTAKKQGFIIPPKILMQATKVIK